jgi:drug/metabolite transporter (DMT)-like permease
MPRPLLWFAIVSLTWGATFAAARIAVQEVPPIFLSGLRYLLVLLLLAPLWPRLPLAFADGRAGRVVLSALLAITATYGLLFWGIRTTPSGMAGLVNMSIIPVGLFGLAIATGEERPSWRLAGSIALGLAGLLALFWTRLEGSGPSAAGLAAIVVGTLCYCLGSVVARPLLRDLDATVLTAAHALAGGLALLVIAFFVEEVGAPTLMALSGWQMLASLGFLSVAGTIVAYTLYLRLMVVWGTVRAGLYAFVSPIVALVIGHLLFAEPIGPVEVAGAGLLLAASALATFRTRVAPP